MNVHVHFTTAFRENHSPIRVIVGVKRGDFAKRKKKAVVFSTTASYVFTY
jgi:hypothetical protein